MSIADTIKARRVKLGISQEELGRRVGVTKTSVGNWEKGKSAPKRANAPRVAKVLGVKLSEVSEQARVGLTLLDERVSGTMIPLMSMGDFLTVALRFDEADLSGFPTISADVKEDAKTVALRIEDADMADEVNIGDVVIVSLAITARENDLVVAHVDDGIVLRRYVPRGIDSRGQKVFDLTSPNPEITTLTINHKHPGKLLAVVTEHRRKLR